MHKNEFTHENQAIAKAQSVTITVCDKRSVTQSAPMEVPSELSLSTAWPAFSEPSTARTTFGPSESIVADFSMMQSMHIN